MYKPVIILYLTCFILYVLFSRRPDYFDGQFEKATIHFVKDSVTGQPFPKAFFIINKQQISIDAHYIFRHYKEGDRVKVIYENSDPQKAAVYAFWGYWITWKELIFSLILLIILLQIALSIVSKPTPEGLISDLESTNKRKKYE